VVRGNPRYRRYLGAELRTSVWNLVELYLAILRDRGETEAQRQFAWFRTIAINPEDGWLFEAMGLKVRRPKLSYADAIGYTGSARGSSPVTRRSDACQTSNSAGNASEAPADARRFSERSSKERSGTCGPGPPPLDVLPSAI